MTFIENARKEGIEPVIGGKPVEAKGYFVEPTVYVDVILQ